MSRVAERRPAYGDRWHLSALVLAPAAQAWLQRARAPRVLHVFDRVCNLLDETGDVLALVTPQAGEGPFSLVAVPQDRASRTSEPRGPGFRELVGPDARIVVRRPRLDVGALTVAWGDAPCRSPRPPWAALRARAERVVRWVPLLRGLAGGTPGGGSGCGVGRTREAPTRAAAGVQRLCDALAAGDAREGRGGVERLCRGLAAGDVREACAGAEALAGRGPGLTPAGDDFLVGALHAVWALGSSGGVRPLAAAIAAAAAPRTTSLSAAWLRGAARGEAAAPWMRLLRALAEDDCDAVVRALRGVLALGHTSGRDGLRGFIAGVRAIARPAPQVGAQALGVGVRAA